MDNDIILTLHKTGLKYNTIQIIVNRYNINNKEYG